MKIIKLIQKHKKLSDSAVKEFIYKNFPQEMINGLEYDDPKTIHRALKLLGVPDEEEEVHADAS